MDFRRSGPLDERRRRVLMDEIASPTDGQSDTESGSGSSKGPVRAYHEAVLSQRQPKVTDLLPVRPLWAVVLLLAGLTVIAAIEAIHVHAVTLPAIEGAQLLAPLNAHAPGSLAAWYSSAMLAAAAALAVIIFSIRAHRIDDYRGQYRVWLWAALALAWLSLDVATRVHNSVGLALMLLAGKSVVTTPLVAGCTLTWIAVYGLIFGTLGLRLIIELWSSRLSLTALLIAGFLYFDTALIELEIVRPPANLIPGTIESTLALLAHFSLLASVGFYARHVLLDASGRLKVHIDPDRKGKLKRAKLKVVKSDSKPRIAATIQPTATHSHASDPARANSSSQSAAPVSSAAKPGVGITKNNLSSPSDYDDEEDEDDSDGSGNLSKSERRRLKKLARREQQRRAA